MKILSKYTDGHTSLNRHAFLVFMLVLLWFLTVNHNYQINSVNYLAGMKNLLKNIRYISSNRSVYYRITLLAILSINGLNICM